MSYVKATKLLPLDLVELIQEYIDGDYIYIPRKEENKKSWGETTGFKSEMATRNEGIYDKYTCGHTVKALAEEYYLSVKSIQRIILNKKREKVA